MAFHQLLKEEISRLARKEVRSHTEALKQASAAAKSEIASLKRRVQELEKALKRGQKTADRAGTGQVTEPQEAGPRHRFSAKRFAAHRLRLKLSAAELGLLLGTSGQTIYQWERGVRPRNGFLPAIAALRQLTPRSASALVKERAATAG